MLRLFKRRNVELDALKVKMMEDGAFKDIMVTRVANTIDDVILLKYIERNKNDNIEAIKWYLDILYPVSNKVVKYILDNRILDLIPNVYTSYCDRKIKRMLLTEDEYRILIKKFKGYDHIPYKIIECMILEMRQNVSHRDCTLEYVMAELMTELISDPDICDPAFKTFSSMVTITDIHYRSYIKAKGGDITIFNTTGIKLDMFLEYCRNNTDIDLSKLNTYIIDEFISLYYLANTRKLKEQAKVCVELILKSNMNNIKYLPDDIIEENHRVIYSDDCDLRTLEYIPRNYITYDLIYRFLVNGGLLIDIPSECNHILDLNLYKTSLIGTINNIDYINSETLDELCKDFKIVDRLLSDESFMTKSNISIIQKLYSTLTLIHTTYTIYELYPLLFRVYKSSALSIGCIQQLIISNPYIVQYIPDYLITERALDYCIDYGSISLDNLKHCKLDMMDIYKLVRYNLQDLLQLDSRTLTSVMSLYGDRLQGRLVDLL